MKQLFRKQTIPIAVVLKSPPVISSPEAALWGVGFQHGNPVATSLILDARLKCVLHMHQQKQTL